LRLVFFRVDLDFVIMGRLPRRDFGDDFHGLASG
jgi:hypothetical protein